MCYTGGHHQLFWVFCLTNQMVWGPLHFFIDGKNSWDFSHELEYCFLQPQLWKTSPLNYVAYAVQRAPCAAAWEFANLRGSGGAGITKNDAASQIVQQSRISAKFQLLFILSLPILLLELLTEEGLSSHSKLLDTVVQAGFAQQALHCIARAGKFCIYWL